MSHVDFLRSLYQAFARGDVPTVMGAMDPKIRWHQAEGHPYMPTGEAFVGPDAVLSNVFMKLGEDFHGFTVHPKTFHDAGKVLVVEGRYTGTHKKTGRALDAQMCHVWTVTDGKLAKFQQYGDTAQFQEVMDA